MIDQRHKEMMRRVRSTILVAFFILIVPAYVLANEKVEICARYSATQNPYHVSATLITGSELNAATHSLDYTSLSQYIVIFWAQNQVSIIEMDSPFFGPSPYGGLGKDQEGR